MTRKLLMLSVIILSLNYGCAEKRKEEVRRIHNHSHQLATAGDFREAISYMEEHIKPKERDSIYYLYHGLYLSLKDPIYNLQKYHADYKKAYELDSKNYDIALSLGQSYGLLDDYQNAIFYLEKAVELYSESLKPSNPYSSLSLAYYDSGDYDKAFEANKKALEISPYNAWNYLDKGLILSHLEGLEPLIENYQRAVEMDPDEIEFPKYYGNRLIEMGYDDLAVEHFNSFLAEDENASWCYADLGYIKMAQGDWEGGKELLDKAESIISNDTLTHMYLAFYYYFRGKIGRAYDYYVDYRLTLEKNTLIHRPKSVKEFEEFFADDRLFQRLQKINSEQEAAS